VAGFSLIHDPWIPCLFEQGGDARWLRPRDIVAGRTRPVDISWGRPDLRVATYELLIGLLTVALGPTGSNAWEDLYDEPPAPEAVDAALAQLAPYFELDGDGPRFMQDLEPLQADELPPEALFIDMQGEGGPSSPRPAVVPSSHGLPRRSRSTPCRPSPRVAGAATGPRCDAADP
jgi:CRISPR system Cascade subunit CasA